MKTIEQKINDYNNKISEHIEKCDFVKLQRKFKEKETLLNGIILKMSDKFLLVQRIEDFLINGFAIIRLDQFERIYFGKFEKAYKRILILENVLNEQPDVNMNINLNSWQSIFESLRKLDFHVSIECEDLEEPSFNIGPIKRISESSVSVQYFDPTGLLDDINTIIKYDNITLLEFGDRYSTIFRKYLRLPNKKRKNKR
jgi:hypothetical protein